MRRLALHVLLILTLILNGISAPWAMARMAHGDHGMPKAAAGDAATPSPHAGMHHAGMEPMAHAHHGAVDAAVPPVAANDAPPADHERACCDGSTCPCGCVLPPALSVVLRVLPMPAPAHVDFTVPASHPTLRHDSPPYRPPAA